MTTALITGANKGIGYEIARELGDRGVTVLAGARDPERGQEAADRLGARFVPIDVTSAESVEAAATWIEQEYGMLDILVNNAGVVSGRGTGRSRAETARAVYETNVFGVIAVTDAMLPLLRRAPRARIVNMSSGLGSLERTADPRNPGHAFTDLAYQSSKTALNMVTVCYAKELAGTPIKVNAANPGFCATDLNAHTGPRSARQGAAVAVRLALLDDDGPTGAFLQDDGPVPW